MQGPVPAGLCVSKPSPSSASLNSPWVTLTPLNHLGEAESQQPITVILMSLFLFNIAGIFQKEGTPSHLHWKVSAGPVNVPSALLIRPWSHWSHGLRLKCCLT